MSGINEKSRSLRKKQTDAERMLWSRLRNRRLSGLKFRRQAPIGPYITDFICHERKLVIELDGSQHLSHRGKDDERTKHIKSSGYRVIRFWDNQVLQDIDSVLTSILHYLESEAPSP